MKKNDGFIILRHDVDNPFLYRKSLFQKILNRVYLSNPEFPGKEHFPTYLEAVKTLLKLEKRFSAKATFFFRTVTYPTYDLIKELRDGKHEVAYHADRDKTFREFHEDLKKVQNRTKMTISGFTKHGISKHRSGGHWDEKKMIEYGNKANLKYLAQGESHPGWETPQLVNGVYVFGHHKTIWKESIEELTRYIESNKWPMLLLHPEDLIINGVKEKFIKILSMTKAISVREALDLIK